jgi:hypothetical protein
VALVRAMMTTARTRVVLVDQHLLCDAEPHKHGRSTQVHPC